ncbi:hypothetical protein BD779DRAFT_1576834 [Infundibulicybe gibba]|nr:hypothetical protein BD779DRAFT_1576834 [Infundibulicybe gibba]
MVSNAATNASLKIAAALNTAASPQTLTAVLPNFRPPSSPLPLHGRRPGSHFMVYVKIPYILFYYTLVVPLSLDVCII